MKYDNEQIFMNSPTFKICHYHNDRDVNVIAFTATIALFNSFSLKRLFSNKWRCRVMNSFCIEILLCISCHLVSMMFWLIYHTGIIPATYEVMNDFKVFISKKDNEKLQDVLTYLQIKKSCSHAKKMKEWDFCNGIHGNKQGTFSGWWLFQNIFNEYDLQYSHHNS